MKHKSLLLLMVLLCVVSVSAVDWYSDYTSRYNITTTTASDLAVMINGSNGFSIDGIKNFIWYNPSLLTGNPAIYNKTPNIYAVANFTTLGWFDNPRGGINNSPTSIYSDVVLALHFDNNGSWNGSANTGSWIDSSGTQAEGVLYAGSPIYVNDSKLGGAYNFDDTTKVLWNDTDNSLDKDIGENMSFTFWVYFDEVQEEGVFGKKDGASRGYYLYTGTGTNGVYLQAGLRTSDGTCDINQDDAFHYGMWYHVAWVIKNNTGSLFYINTTSLKNNTDVVCVAGNASNNDAFRVGTEQNQYGIPFDGIIEELKIYKRALTHAEILDDFNNGIYQNNLLSEADYYNPEAPAIPDHPEHPVILINDRRLSIIDKILRI